jgi:hypothetical protein
MTTNTAYEVAIATLTETILKLKDQNKVLLEVIEELKNTPNSITNTNNSVALSVGMFTLGQLDEIVKNEINLKRVLKQLLDVDIQKEIVARQKNNSAEMGAYRSPEYEAARILGNEIRYLIEANSVKL